MNDPKSRKKAPEAEHAVDVMDDAQTLQTQSRHILPSDTLGSYTGTDAYGDDPEQDADDL